MAFKSKHGAPMAWLREHVSHAGSDCLTWPFARAKKGYGNLQVERNYTSAHRVMAILAHGEPPFPDAQAAHTCGNGHEGCVNPRHLEWKSCKGNHANKIAHGTHNRGSRQWKSRLSNEQVLAIYRDQRPDGVIAAEFACSRENVTRIQAGKTWAWLTQNQSEGAALCGI
jgi:hypothetical protein